jgi:hypothetical protein
MIFGRAVSRLRNETVLTLQSTDGWFNGTLSSGQSVSRDSAMLSIFWRLPCAL